MIRTFVGVFMLISANLELKHSADEPYLPLFKIF